MSLPLSAAPPSDSLMAPGVSFGTFLRTALRKPGRVGAPVRAFVYVAYVVLTEVSGVEVV